MKRLLCAALALVTVTLYAVIATPAKEHQATKGEREPSHSQRALTYRDPRSGVIFYVETDGRHVSGISPDGKLLWTRDPFREAGLKPYRVPYPRIDDIGEGDYYPPGSDEVRVTVRIYFDSSQAGDLDPKTGKFTYVGRD